MGATLVGMPKNFQCASYAITMSFIATPLDLLVFFYLVDPVISF